MMKSDLLTTRLAAFGVDEATIRDLLPLLDGVLGSDELRHRAARQADSLRSRIGQYFATGSVFDDGESRPGSVEGPVPLVALLDVLGDVDVHWRSRGIPSDVRAATAHPGGDVPRDPRLRGEVIIRS